MTVLVHTPTPDQIETARRRLAQGMASEDVARRLGVSEMRLVMLVREPGLNSDLAAWNALGAKGRQA